ncbi:MAG: 30S ribosomal protein S8 [Patescibacteria group bacterium]
MSAITDLIIRVKNGYMAGRDTIESPYSKYREQVIQKLIALRYVKDYSVTGDIKKTMSINLVYKNGAPALTEVKIFSTPGRRWYVAAKDLKPVLGGLGYSLVSTPLGILTHIEAKKKNVGGELLFNIW